MRFSVKLINVGEGFGVAIPGFFLKSNGIEEGDEFMIEILSKDELRAKVKDLQDQINELGNQGKINYE